MPRDFRSAAGVAATGTRQCDELMMIIIIITVATFDNCHSAATGTLFALALTDEATHVLEPASIPLEL